MLHGHVDDRAEAAIAHAPPRSPSPRWSNRRRRQLRWLGAADRSRRPGLRRKQASLISTRDRATVQGPRSSVIHHRGRLRHSGTRADDVRRTDASASASAYLDQAWRGEPQALVDRAIQAASQRGAGALGWAEVLVSLVQHSIELSFSPSAPLPTPTRCRRTSAKRWRILGRHAHRARY